MFKVFFDEGLIVEHADYVRVVLLLSHYPAVKDFVRFDNIDLLGELVEGDYNFTCVCNSFVVVLDNKAELLVVL